MNKKLYCCYSIKLRDYLTKRGLRYELCALNPNSKSMFWVYIKTDALTQALTMWDNTKDI